MKLAVFAGVMFALCGFAALIYLSDDILPYSVDHFKRINAVKLASIIRTWGKNGGSAESARELESSNSSMRIFLLKTNIVVAGSTCTTVVGLEAENFRQRGILLGTTNAEVFWLNREGRATVVLPKK